MIKRTLIDLLIKWEQAFNDHSINSTKIGALRVDAYAFLYHPTILLRSDNDDITFDELNSFGSTTLASQVWQVAVGNLNTYTSQVESELSQREISFQPSALESIIHFGDCKSYILANSETRRALAATSSFFHHYTRSSYHWIEKFKQLGCTTDDLDYLVRCLKKEKIHEITDKATHLEKNSRKKLKYLIDTDFKMDYATLYESYQLAQDLPLSPLSKLFLLSGNPQIIHYALVNFNELQIHHADIIINSIAFSGSVSGFIFAANYYQMSLPLDTALLPASYCSDLRLFNYLRCRYQISVNAADEQGWTLMHHAAKMGNLKKINYFRQLGCSTEKTKSHEYPIHIAAQFGNLETLKLLEEQGYYYNVVNLFRLPMAHTETIGSNNIKYNILLLAVRYGHLNIVEYLLAEKQFDFITRFNQLGNLLHLACMSHNENLVSYLIDEHHYDVTEKNKYGHNAFHFAASSGSLKILMLLDSLNITLSQTIDGEGSSPLFLATSSNQKEIIYYLIALGLDINKTNHQGNTPLHFAAYLGKTNAVMALLEKKASRTIINQAQQDALTYALSNSKMKEGMKDKLRYLFAQYQVEPEAAPSAPAMMRS